MPIDLRERLPDIYKGNGGQGTSVLETDALMFAENSVFEQALNDFARVQANQYVATADITGIERYEKMLSIIANPATESLEFRRARILNRFALHPPYTLKWLQSRLDSIIGVGAWETVVDYDNYTLYIDSASEDQGWYNEFHITMALIKPANIVFINRPLFQSVVGASVELSGSEKQYNYRAGTTAFASETTPLVSLNSIGVLKMASTPSVQQEFLNMLANSANSNVAYILVNDILRIDVFERTVTSNVLEIVFAVAQANASGITVMENVKLCASDDTVYDSSPCNVPVLGDLQCRFKIPFKEVLE
ncbi:YmfQ family protein [Ruminococcaceae bacterium OttesenSCG-928-N02]|nr:YmfQ family protein [Ruminococcaceae bacterium OttesenSCG-928-N02]